jgi:hypothetical protein
MLIFHGDSLLIFGQIHYCGVSMRLIVELSLYMRNCHFIPEAANVAKTLAVVTNFNEQVINNVVALIFQCC